MVTTILSHKVKDFQKCKRIFDADASLRQRAGIKIIGLYASLDKPNYITIISEFPNPQFFHEFIFGPQMKEKMKKAGVISELETRILNKI